MVVIKTGGRDVTLCYIVNTHVLGPSDVFLFSRKEKIISFEST